MCFIIRSMWVLQSYLRSLVAHMSTWTNFLKVWTLNLHQSYFTHTVFTCACHWDFCKHVPCTLTRILTYILKKISTFLLPIEFLNRFSVPLGMRVELREGISLLFRGISPRSDCTRLNEAFSMELANSRLSNPKANHSLWLGRSHTKVRLWIYFEMKTYSKLLHELDFVLRKISHGNSKWFSCEQCICNTKLCVHDCSLQHWW